jgi:predicted nucleic acid-binding protein
MKYVLTDTGFWRALLDSDDDLRRQSVAKEAFDLISKSNLKLLIPSIIYSELLNTRFLKQKNKKYKIDYLEKLLQMGIIESKDDTDFRKEALENTLREGKRCQELSFADNIIRIIVRDFQKDIKYLITFDEKLMRECEKHVSIYEKCYSAL